MLKRIKFSKIKQFLKKLPRILAKNAFLTFLFLFFGALIFGGFLFYQCTILVQKTEITPSKELVQFNKKLYQKVLIEWDKREKIYKETDLKELFNPFYLEQNELTE